MEEEEMKKEIEGGREKGGKGGGGRDKCQALSWGRYVHHVIECSQQAWAISTCPFSL
jgi:hypothetical protein